MGFIAYKKIKKQSDRVEAWHRVETQKDKIFVAQAMEQIDTIISLTKTK